MITHYNKSSKIVTNFVDRSLFYDYDDLMKTQKYDFTTLKVQMTKKKREEAKAFAKSKGYTFGSWVGLLIEEALRQQVVSK